LQADNRRLAANNQVEGKAMSDPRDTTDRPTGQTLHDRLEFETCDPICSCEAEPRWLQLQEELERENLATDEHG
jgi:hypothetical protein